MAIKVTVTVDLSGFGRLDKELRHGGPRTTRVLKKWAVRYRGFAERRFVRFSRGGGDWAPLKAKRKRGGKK